MRNDEIIKSIGPYTLVARKRPDACKGVIWLDGKTVFETSGDSLDDVLIALESQRAELVAAKLQANAVSDPTAEMARKAFVALLPGQPPNRLAMLRAHFQSPDQCISANQLAEAVGYANYGAANLQYGLLAAAFFEYLPTELPKRKDGTRIWTFALADAGNVETSPETEWVWKLKPYVAQGLRLAGV